MSKNLKNVPWDGTVGSVPAADANNVITITTGAELAALAVEVNDNSNDYTGYTILLGDDIDLNNQAWRPIGLFWAYGDQRDRAFRGTFDGANRSITNLYVNLEDTDGYGETAALFGYIDFPAASGKGIKEVKTTPEEKAEEEAAALGLSG